MVYEGKGVRSAHLAKPNRPAVRRAAANSATIALNGSLDADKGCGEAERLGWFWSWSAIHPNFFKSAVTSTGCCTFSVFHAIIIPSQKTLYKTEDKRYIICEHLFLF